jgi:hypothetical protein
MPQIALAIVGETKDLNRLLFSLFESDSVEAGMSKEIPGGSIALRPMSLSKDAAGLSVIEFALSCATAVGTSLIAAYLYDKLKPARGTTTRILIERRGIEISESAISKIFEETISLELESSDEEAGTVNVARVEATGELFPARRQPDTPNRRIF